MVSWGGGPPPAPYWLRPWMGNLSQCAIAMKDKLVILPKWPKSKSGPPLVCLMNRTTLLILITQMKSRKIIHHKYKKKAVCKPRNHETTERNSEIAKRDTFSQNLYLKYKVVVYMNKSRPMQEKLTW